MPYYHPFLPIKKTIRLPEYDYIGITELEQTIIDTPCFQRLRRIRQSPGVSMVYPGSSHSRFEHSLGAMHLAGEATTHIILNLKNKGDVVLPIAKLLSSSEITRTSQLIQIARLGGLLHDVGHGPLSHTFETFLEMSNIKWAHENLSLEIIWKKLKPFFLNTKVNSYKVDVREIMSLLCDYNWDGDKVRLTVDVIKILKSIGLKTADIGFMEKFLKNNWFLNQIIKGEPYNADRFNYLILDSNRTGAIEYGSIDVQRLLQNLTLNNNSITLFENGKNAAKRFFEAYCHMYKSVYQHKTAYGADLHFALCMVRAAKYNQFFKKLSMTPPTMNDVLNLYDDVIFHELIKTKPMGVDKKLISDFLHRKILVPAYETYDPEFVEIVDKRGGEKKFIQEIRKKAVLPSNTLIIIRYVKEKKATVAPPSIRTLKRLGFLNKKTGELLPLDPDPNVLAAFEVKTLYRVYTIKDKKIKEKVSKAIKSLLR